MSHAHLPRVLILPGWLDSLEGHWQTRWETRYGFRRVRQQDWVWPKRNDWVRTLEAVVAEADTPCILVAHSLGCILTAHWATTSALTDRIRGALLVAPPDIERPQAPEELRDFAPAPVSPLPFPAIAVYSNDDPFSDADWARQRIAAWGARPVEIGARGHINGDSGLGDWPEGIALIRPWLEEGA